MASISASIELYDRMSAPLYSMMSAMNSVINTFHTMDSAFDDGFDTGSIAAAEVAMQQMESQMEQVHNQIQNSNEEQQKLNNNMSKGASAADDLVSKVQNLATAYLSMQGIQKVLGVSDELVSTTARLDQMNDGLQTTDELLKMVYISAQDARGSFGDMAAVVAKFGNNAKCIQQFPGSCCICKPDSETDDHCRCIHTGSIKCNVAVVTGFGFRCVAW